MDQDVKMAFPPQPMVSYQGVGKFSSYLVRAKFHPVERIQW